jgi:hypothetical protein
MAAPTFQLNEKAGRVKTASSSQLNERQVTS